MGYPVKTVNTIVAALAGSIAAAILTLSIGGGTVITKHLRATTSVNVSALGRGQSTSTNITVTGATVGAHCTAEVINGDLTGTTSTLAGTPCRITATDTVTIYFYNATGTASFDAGSSTLSVQVWNY